MIALRTIDLRNDFKRISEIVSGGETVLITRPHNNNLVVISEVDYNELIRNRNNIAYAAKIEKSLQELIMGKTVTMSINELEEMEK